MKKRGLGRSLNAILSPTMLSDSSVDGEKGTAATEGRLQSLLVTELFPGEYQPRREMDEEAIHELALSIQAQGILQPIIARHKNGRFEIIAGERRWRAAKKAGLDSVPVIVKDIPDEAAMAVGLIENIQRENLNAIDEAFGLQRLLKEFSLTHQEIAEAIGRSRTAVSNLLRLLNLPEAVQKYLQHGDLEMGHARALLSLPEPQQLRAADHVVEKNLSVRETEKYIKQLQSLEEARHAIKLPSKASPEIEQWQRQLSARLGSKVIIQQGEKGKGKILIHYASDDDLAALCERVCS